MPQWRKSVGQIIKEFNTKSGELLEWIHDNISTAVIKIKQPVSTVRLILPELRVRLRKRYNTIDVINKMAIITLRKNKKSARHFG